MAGQQDSDESDEDRARRYGWTQLPGGTWIDDDEQPRCIRCLNFLNGPPLCRCKERG